jgi:hypothetical protein
MSPELPITSPVQGYADTDKNHQSKNKDGELSHFDVLKRKNFNL